MAYPPPNLSPHSSGQVIASADINALDDSIQTIVAELGSGPKGASADLTARLAAIVSMPSALAAVDANTIGPTGDAAVMVIVSVGDLYLQGANQTYIDMEPSGSDLYWLLANNAHVRLHVGSDGAFLVLQPADSQTAPLIDFHTGANQGLFRVDADGSINAVATDGTTLMKLSVTNAGVATWAPA